MVENYRSALLQLHSCTEALGYDIFGCHKITLPLPCEERLCDVLLDHEGPGEAERNALGLEITHALVGKLMAFCVRMASLAVQRSDARYLRCAALALVLDRDVMDPRDVYRLASILYHAANHVGVDPESVLRDVALFGTELRTRLLLEGFLGGPSYMKALRSMGVDLVDITGVSTYRVNLF